MDSVIAGLVSWAGHHGADIEKTETSRTITTEHGRIEVTESDEHPGRTVVIESEMANVVLDDAHITADGADGYTFYGRIIPEIREAPVEVTITSTWFQ